MTLGDERHMHKLAKDIVERKLSVRDAETLARKRKQASKPAKLLRQDDFGIAVGNPADIVVFDAASPEQAVAEVIAPEAGFKAGRRTFTRPAGELHRPG